MPDTIITDSQAEMVRLQTINNGIEAEIHAIITGSAPGQRLSQQELSRIQDLRKDQTPVLNAIQELALITAADLDNSATVQHLAGSLNAVLADLNAASARIAAISAACAQITAACTGINGIITALTALIGTSRQ